MGEHEAIGDLCHRCGRLAYEVVHTDTGEIVMTCMECGLYSDETGWIDENGKARDYKRTTEQLTLEEVNEFRRELGFDPISELSTDFRDDGDDDDEGSEEEPGVEDEE